MFQLLAEAGAGAALREGRAGWTEGVDAGPTAEHASPRALAAPHAPVHSAFRARRETHAPWHLQAGSEMRVLKGREGSCHLCCRRRHCHSAPRLTALRQHLNATKKCFRMAPESLSC